MLPDFFPGVCVGLASVPRGLDGATARGVLWQAAPGRFLLDAPDAGRYLVEGGSRITIEPSPRADDAEVDRFLRMTPYAALLFQRGIPAFHAAALSGPNGVVLIAGDSGAGKSTLAASLLKRGFYLLADDLAAVDVDESGRPMVYPAFPELVLWSDAMEKLEIEHNGKGRYFIAVKELFEPKPQPLRAIYRLSVHKAEIEISGVEGAKVFNALTTLSYNSHISDALFDRAAYMRQAAGIARHVPLRSLRRPRGRWCVDELADLVEGTCS